MSVTDSIAFLLSPLFRSRRRSSDQALGGDQWRGRYCHGCGGSALESNLGEGEPVRTLARDDGVILEVPDVRHLGWKPWRLLLTDMAPSPLRHALASLVFRVRVSRLIRSTPNSAGCGRPKTASARVCAR